ncbi:MAG TPA: glycosyltransferase family 39 protein [Anaerolineae bacterium]|nr:glycosyltransferase family 39 protein [Anaerolineae bacterium]HOQ97864.1 glycosyltransferase family 39 protein [Anaerolineae bacterium]HPL26969.1 glycosyltransferase family 39 protein [Anaerolineae bacterium]
MAMQGSVGRREAPAVPQAAWLRRAVQVRWPAVALAAIVLLALLLRLARLDLVEFKADEVQPLALADELWLDHRFSLSYGVSSTGLPETPLIGYLLVLPRALSADPRWGVAFIALLDTLGVLATYAWLRRFAGLRLALLAAALYAANPWATLLARKTWAEILPLFTVLILWSACEVIVSRKPAWAIVFFPLLALQVQAHVMGFLFLPAALLTVALFPRRWWQRYSLLAIALGLLILLPYGVVLARAWGVTKGALQQNTQAGLIFDHRALTYALWLASGATLSALLGHSASALQGWEQALGVVRVATAAALAAGLGRIGWHVLRRRRLQACEALLLIWLAGPLLPLVLVRGAQGIHYLLLVVPALFVLAALGWELLVAVRLRPLAWGGLLALATVLAVQAGAVFAVYNGVAHYSTEGGFGRPLGYWLQVQREVHAQATAAGWQHLYVLGIDDAPWSGERQTLDYLLRRQVRLRYVGQGGRPGVLVPAARDAGALIIRDDPRILELLAQFGSERLRWPGPHGSWGIRLFALRHSSAEDVAHAMTHPLPTRLDNGMCLLGARLPREAQRGRVLSVVTYWAYGGQAGGAPNTDMAFYHLLGNDERRWAQYDGFALSSSQWHPGETLIQWFELGLPPDMPPGDYWLRTGMYSWRDMTGAQVIDEAGRPLGDAVRLGPIRIGE